jgi:hypothetical protein
MLGLAGSMSKPLALAGSSSLRNVRSMALLALPIPADQVMVKPAALFAGLFSNTARAKTALTTVRAACEPAR